MCALNNTMLHSLFKNTKTSTKLGTSESDSGSSRSSSRITKQNGRRLERAKNIRGFRCSDDDLSADAWRSSLLSNDLSADTSRSSLFINNGHSSETFSGSIWGSRPSSPPNLFFPQPTSSADAYSSLASPPFLKFAMPQQNHSPLSSPRSWDGDDGTSGYSSDSASSNGSYRSTGDRPFSAYIRHSEGDLEDLAGRDFEASVGATPELQICRTRDKAHKSTPSSRHVSPVSSPKAWGLHKAVNGSHICTHADRIQKKSSSNSIFMSPESSPRYQGFAIDYLQQDSTSRSSRSPSHWADAHHLHTGCVGVTGEFRIRTSGVRAQKSAPSSRHVSPMSSPKAWGFNKEVNGSHICTHADRTQKSAPISIFTSPESSPRVWGSTVDHLQQPRSSRLPSHQADAHPLPLPLTFSTTVSAPSSPRSSMFSPQDSCRVESTASSAKWLKGRLLGSGAFGKVYKGINSETGEFCAIKEVEFEEDDVQARDSVKQLAQEIMFLSSLRHPNIVRYKGSEMMKGRLNIYLELVSGGSIHKLCQEFKRLEEPVIRRYTQQILWGLHYLHSRNTVHRDIKCANILVDQGGTVKLADFGMAKQIKEQGTEFLSFKGSPYWMAPEVIMQRNTDFAHAVDIWSLGCTVLEMVTGKPPWSEYEGVAAMFKISRAETPPIPDSLSPEGKSFIRLCLQRNPADRPSAAVLLQHPFVQFTNKGPDFKIFDVKEGGTHKRKGGNSNGLLRGGSQLLSNSKNTHPSLQPGICTSRTAPIPISSRSSYTDMSNFSSIELLSEFSVQPTRSSRKMEFSDGVMSGKRSNEYSNSKGRVLHATNEVPGFDIDRKCGNRFPM